MLTVSTDNTQRAIKAREGEDRRNEPDRRKSSVDMRLRVGLWYQYHRATRSGEFDLLPRNPYTRAKVQEALLPEMQKYRFALRNTPDAAVAASCALASALDFLWSHPELACNVAGEPMAVYTINGLSEYLVRTYQVTMLDRRKSDRRTTAAAS